MQRNAFDPLLPATLMGCGTGAAKQLGHERIAPVHDLSSAGAPSIPVPGTTNAMPNAAMVERLTGRRRRLSISTLRCRIELGHICGCALGIQDHPGEREGDPKGD